MGKALGIEAMAQVPEVVAVVYARATRSPTQVVRLADRLPWYLNCQSI
jgi:hypothetical protein